MKKLMTSVLVVTVAVILSFVLGIGSPAAAAPATVEEAGFLSAPWKFHVNLYGWLPDAPAEIRVDGKKVVDVPEDVDTILDSLQRAGMFELEVHKGPLIFFANNVYYKGKYDKNFKGPVTGLPKEYTLQEEVWVIKYGAGYELGPWNLGKSDDSPTWNLIPWVGAFYFHDSWKLKIEDRDGSNADKVNGTYKFNTPMVGLGARPKLSERWYLNLSYGYGGWDVDHVEYVHDFIGNVSYRFNMWNVSSKVFAGYRYLHFERKEQKKEIDLKAYGPFFGIGWEF